MVPSTSLTEPAAPPGGQAGWRRYRFAGLVALGVVAALLTLGAWAVSSPAQSSPDDDFHLASIWCRSAAGAPQCDPVPLPNPEEDLGVVLYRVSDWPMVCFLADPTRAGDCPVLDTYVVRASDGLYPPLFYAYASLFVGDSPGDQVAAIRFAVAVSVLALFTAAYLVALPWLRAPMLLSWVVGSMPFGVFLFASTNPSAWAVAGLAALWGPMVTAFLTDGARRWAAVAIWLLGGVMAAGSRGDAALFVIGVSGLGMLLFLAKKNWPVLLAGGGLIVAAAGFFFTSGHSRLAAESFVDTFARQPRHATVWSMVEAWPTYWSALSGAPWGRTGESDMLGWIDMPLPTGVWLPTTLVVGGLIWSGLAVMYWRKAAVIAVVAVVVVVVPTRSLLQTEVLGGTLFQPRYVLPLLMVWFGVLLLARPGAVLRFTRTQLLVAAILLGYAATIALHAWLRRFVTGNDVVDVNLDRAAEWWTFPAASPMGVWAVGSLAWLVLIALAFGHYWPRRGGKATTTPQPQ